MRILIDLTSLADNFSGIERFAECISYEMLMQSEDDFILVFKEKIYPLFERFILNKNVKMVVLPRWKKLLFHQMRLPMAILFSGISGAFFLF